MLDAKAKLLDVGHTFQVRYDSLHPGEKVKIEEQEFELLQFHFHKPSEHLINGKQYEMVAHFVFFKKNKNASPTAFVLGVMILEGKHNDEIAKIWNFLPPYREGYEETDMHEISDWREAAATSELEIQNHLHQEKVLEKNIKFDLTGILPKKADFIIYNGSLTTPGCNEGITHAVSLAPVYLEHEQIEHFEGYYEGNNRDIQSIGMIKNGDFRRATVVL